MRDISRETESGDQPVATERPVTIGQVEQVEHLEQEHLEQTEILLAARRYLYTLFQSLLGTEPSLEQFQAIGLPLAREAFVILWEQGAVSTQSADEPSADSHPPIREFLEALDAASKNPESLKPEYTQLLIGPNKLSAPPWESVYTTGERVIFQRSTLEIRNFYRSQGFIPQLYPKVADDHIALELDFLRLLAERALMAFQVNEQKTLCEAIQASGDFLDEHLLKWVDRFAGDLARDNKSKFYATLAPALVTFVNRDRELVLNFTGRQ
jgi:TorA maturation chaperone TorD